MLTSVSLSRPYNKTTEGVLLSFLWETRLHLTGFVKFSDTYLLIGNFRSRHHSSQSLNYTHVQVLCVPVWPWWLLMGCKTFLFICQRARLTFQIKWSPHEQDTLKPFFRFIHSGFKSLFFFFLTTRVDSLIKMYSVYISFNHWYHWTLISVDFISEQSNTAHKTPKWTFLSNIIHYIWCECYTWFIQKHLCKRKKIRFQKYLYR